MFSFTARSLMLSLNLLDILRQIFLFQAEIQKITNVNQDLQKKLGRCKELLKSKKAATETLQQKFKVLTDCGFVKVDFSWCDVMWWTWTEQEPKSEYHRPFNIRILLYFSDQSSDSRETDQIYSHRAKGGRWKRWARACWSGYQGSVHHHPETFLFVKWGRSPHHIWGRER